MIFSDPAFLFGILPLTVGLFYLLAARFGKTAGLAVLFVSSIIIYYPWGEHNVLILLSSVCVNFISLAVLASARQESLIVRRTALAIGLLYNLTTLIWFKYTIIRIIFCKSFGGDISIASLAIPIGISFYTFQQASVLADAYAYEPSLQRFMGDLRSLRGKVEAFVRYGYFVTFFPHMIIGPIAYVHEIQPQLEARKFGRLQQIDIAVGLMLIGIGVFKKLVLADNLALAVDPVFYLASQGSAINPISAWLGVFGYYAQLYFDFSGYSDMALGLARLFGIIFPINFFSPLKAVGIVDFYRRWHMTLTRVISRFLFCPLSFWGARYAARNNLARVPSRLLGLWIPLLLNFEMIGLWHGAIWTFVLFGAIHGAWYILEMEVQQLKAWTSWKKRTSPGERRVIGRMMFVIPMALTFAIFRSESIPAFLHLLSQLVSFDILSPRSTPTLLAAQWILLSFFIIHALPNSVELMARYKPGIMTYENEAYGFRLGWRPTWAWSGVWLVLVMTSLHYIWRQPPFLYMGF